MRESLYQSRSERSSTNSDLWKNAESNRNRHEAIHPCSRRRSRHRELSLPEVEGVGVEPERLRATRFSGPVSAPRGPHLPKYSRRESNPYVRCEKAPPCAVRPREQSVSGWNRTKLSELRTLGSHPRAETKPARESNPAIRFRRPESDPSGEHVEWEASAASIGRDLNPRYTFCGRAPYHLATDATVQARGFEPR